MQYLEWYEKEFQIIVIDLIFTASQFLESIIFREH